MASIGHVAVGLAAARGDGKGRVNGRSAAAWSALSLLPDADVIGFALGIPYAHTWGHRGATHSLAFVLAAGVAFAVAARRFKRPFGRTVLVATLVLASHPLLDTMTDGGLGCAVLWPFDSTRYFAPWRPIPVAPIGFSFFSHGGAVILTELLLFAPLFWLALRGPAAAEANRTIRWTVVVLWLISTWLIASSDPVREALVGGILREDTAYASGFSESRFRTIAAGHSEADVLRLLGPAVAEGWFYGRHDAALNSAAESSASSASTCAAVTFENDVVVGTLDRRACQTRGIAIGLTREQVRRVLGPPSESCWRYTWSPRGARYRMRMVCFAKAKVATVFRRWE